MIDLHSNSSKDDVPEVQSFDSDNDKEQLIQTDNEVELLFANVNSIINDLREYD